MCVNIKLTPGYTKYFKEQEAEQHTQPAIVCGGEKLYSVCVCLCVCKADNKLEIVASRVGTSWLG